MKSLSAWLTGPFLIMIAGVMWSLDAIIRTKIGVHMSPATIVFFEHVIGFALLVPFLPKALQEIRHFTRRDWMISATIALFASVLGTIFFTSALTRSFGVSDFTTPIFLQKFQPLFAIVLAVIFLGEKLKKRFYIGAPLALLGGYLISFGSSVFPIDFSGKAVIVLLSLLAAFAWGSGTVLGRSMRNRASFSTMTTVRFALALPISFIVLIILEPDFFGHMFQGLFHSIQIGSTHHYVTLPIVLGFVLIGLFTGAGALLVYYRGLIRTPAHIATLCELSFPIMTLFIAISVFNPYGSPEVLDTGRVLGMILILTGILIVSWPSRDS